MYRWPDGKVYTGQWQESKMHGEGQLKWKDGSRSYKGSFKNDLRSGYGEYMWAFGKKFYRGHWKDGKQHGLGFVKEGEEDFEKKSLWLNGKLVRWLADGDSDDEEVLATAKMYGTHLGDEQGKVNSEDLIKWNVSQSMSSNSQLLSAVKLVRTANNSE